MNFRLRPNSQNTIFLNLELVESQSSLMNQNLRSVCCDSVSPLRKLRDSEFQVDTMIGSIKLNKTNGTK